MKENTAHTASLIVLLFPSQIVTKSESTHPQALVSANSAGKIISIRLISHCAIEQLYTIATPFCIPVKNINLYPYLENDKK